MTMTDPSGIPGPSEGPFEGLAQPGDEPTAAETSANLGAESSASTDPATSAPLPDAAPSTESGSTAGPVPGETPKSDVPLGTSPAAPATTSGEPAPAEPTDSPVTVTSDREGVASEIAGTSVTPADVPEGVTVVGYNPTDGMPILQDPAYRGKSDPTFENVKLARNLAVDETATEAERSSGERTLTARPVDESEILDASFVGMAPAVEYRPAQGIRVLRMDRPFRAGGAEGKAGDYLGEFNGQRMVITQAELDEHFVVV